MSDKNYLRPADAMQIMAGEYLIKQANIEVGKLHVENTTDPAHTKEHWLLYSAYHWPSTSYRSQELLFVYQGEPQLLATFLRDPPAGSTYILADCQQQTLP